jgi:hypothetical protein
MVLDGTLSNAHEKFEIQISTSDSIRRWCFGRSPNKEINPVEKIIPEK